MVEQFAIRAEAEAVRDFDAVPQLGDFAGRVDPEERARRRLALEIKLADVAAESAEPDTAVVVGGEIVDAEEWLAFPFSEKVVKLAGFCVPAGEGEAGHDDATVLIESDAPNRFAVGNEGLDLAVGIAAVDAATADVAEVEAVLFVGAGSFEQAIAGR